MKEDEPAVQLPVSCNKDCGAGCPLLAEVRDGRLTAIRDNPFRSPYMTGCVRGYQMPRIVYSKKRLYRPLIRTGPRGSGQFRETGWKEALEFVADRLEEIRGHWQAESVLNLGGYGSCRGAMHNTALLTRRFLSLFGGFTDCSGNYSSGAESFVVPYLFGTRHAGRSGIDAQTLKHSRLILLWGANISDTRFGCEIENLVREQKKRGTPIIVIDPRRSRTVQRLGSQWVPIRPGSDTAFMAAVLYVLLSNGLIERDSLSRVCVGFDALEGYIRGAVDGQPKTPSWAEAICGTPRKTISDLAVKYGTTKPAALIPGLSIQRTIGGEEAIRMAVALQSATGNIGVPGGSSGTSIWNRLPVPRCGELPVPEVPGAPSVPVYRWSDAVLQGRGAEFSTDIRAIYNVGSNYLAMGSDIYKNIRAFERVDFSVCHDYFLTPTARYCDVVLPATTFLEREDVVFPETNHLLYSHQVIDPIGESRNDYDIFSELADRLGFVENFTEGKSAAQWIDSFLAESEVVDIDEFRRRGIYTGAEQTRSGLSDFVADPINFPLDTPSGKIELASRDYERLGVPPYPTWRGFSCPERYPLYLITPHARYRINSQYAEEPWFLDKEKQCLWMNSEDAAARAIVDGEEVEVESPRGRLRVPACITDEIMSGVVSLLAGMEPQIDSDGIDRAGAANMLTSTEPTQPSQSSRTHSVAVEVRSATKSCENNPLHG